MYLVCVCVCVGCGGGRGDGGREDGGREGGRGDDILQARGRHTHTQSHVTSSFVQIEGSDGLSLLLTTMSFMASREGLNPARSSNGSWYSATSSAKNEK